MKIKIAKTNKEFNELYSFLQKKYEIETQLIFKNTIDEEKELTINESRGAVYKDGQLCLLFLDANPFKLQLFGLNNSADVTEILVKYLYDNKILIKGVLGNKEDTDLFIEVYKEYFKNKITLTMSMDIMNLTELKEIPVQGYIKRASVKDYDLIFKWIKEFVLEAIPLDYDEEKIIKMSQSFTIDEFSYIYYNDENIPTSIVRTNKFFNGARVSLVYTDKQHRSKGYAKSMMYMVCKKTFSDYNPKYITLYVDKLNPISNKVYKDIGFEILRNQYDYTVI